MPDARLEGFGDPEGGNAAGVAAKGMPEQEAVVSWVENTERVQRWRDGCFHKYCTPMGCADEGCRYLHTLMPSEAATLVAWHNRGVHQVFSGESCCGSTATSRTSSATSNRTEEVCRTHSRRRAHSGAARTMPSNSSAEKGDYENPAEEAAAGAACATVGAEEHARAAGGPGPAHCTAGDPGPSGPGVSVDEEADDKADDDKDDSDGKAAGAGEAAGDEEAAGSGADADDGLQFVRQLAASLEGKGEEAFLARVPKDDEGNPTSIGSVLHQFGKCTPCTEECCKDGIHCLCCHFDHKRKGRRSKVRPCKSKRYRYRKLVNHLTEGLKADPDSFKLEEERMPPSIAANPILMKKLTNRMNNLLESIKAENMQKEQEEANEKAVASLFTTVTTQALTCEGAAAPGGKGLLSHDLLTQSAAVAPGIYGSPWGAAACCAGRRLRLGPGLPPPPPGLPPPPPGLPPPPGPMAGPMYVLGTRASQLVQGPGGAAYAAGSNRWAVSAGPVTRAPFLCGAFCGMAPPLAA